VIAKVATLKNVGFWSVTLCSLIQTSGLSAEDNDCIFRAETFTLLPEYKAAAPKENFTSYKGEEICLLGNDAVYIGKNYNNFG
jgi:hypothetical protein